MSKQLFILASYHTPPSVPEAAREKSGIPMAAIRERLTHRNREQLYGMRVR